MKYKSKLKGYYQKRLGEKNGKLFRKENRRVKRNYV